MTTRRKTAPLPVRAQRSAGGVAFRRVDGRVDVVLVRVGRPGRWQLPKGLIDRGESPELAAIRETREEGGVETELVAPLETIEYWYVGDDADGTRVRFHKFVHFFLLQYLAGDPSTHDREVEEARWIPLGDAITQIAFASERRVLEAARELLAT